jgi:hypothetical protein
MVYGIASGVAIRLGEARASSELEDWRLKLALNEKTEGLGRQNVVYIFER